VDPDRLRAYKLTINDVSTPCAAEPGTPRRPPSQRGRKGAHGRTTGALGRRAVSTDHHRQPTNGYIVKVADVGFAEESYAERERRPPERHAFRTLVVAKAERRQNTVETADEVKQSPGGGP